MDIRRVPKPTSWGMLFDEIDFVIKSKPCSTLVIDTVDWAEQLCIEQILSIYGKKGIEDFGYGSGYVYEKEEFGRFLNKLESVIEVGINVVLTAHAQLRKFSQPDEIGEYDRWELKLGKKTGSQISPLIKEWCDLLIFTNYRTYAVAIDSEGKRFKAQGGKERVMYTEHHSCWDAKNRHNLPPEMPLDYKKIEHIFSFTPENLENSKCYFSPQTNDIKIAPAVPGDNYIEITEEERKAITSAIKETESVYVPTTSELPNVSNKALADLMAHNGVNESEIQKVVSLKGYYPENTPIENYDEGFVNGVLVGAWDKVFEMIKEQRELSNIPF